VAAVRETAGELYLAIWGRGPVQGLAIDDDRAAGTAFLTGALVP
jgi:hypothetical protein